MAQGSTIEWTEATWNPVTGCTKLSTGCKHCYAERMAKRLKAMGKTQYRNEFRLTLQPDMLNRPREWRNPRVIFVNSMSDLFHEKVPLHFIKSVFEVMNECPQHTFQVLTKRPHIAEQYHRQLYWSDNIWMGTSVENSEFISRIRSLTRVPARVRFLSLEPLLGPLSRLPLSGIDWVIAGGESGPRARRMEGTWVRGIRDRCIRYEVPFFFKQWGGKNKKRAGRKLDGRTWDEMPSRCSNREGLDSVGFASSNLGT